MAIQTITVDGATYDIGVKVANISGTLPISKGGTGATTAADARTNLGLGSAATHAHSEYSKVTVTQTLQSGTEVGKITVDGTTTTLYAPTDTDTKVTQTRSTTAHGSLLLSPINSTVTTSTTTTTTYRTATADYNESNQGLVLRPTQTFTEGSPKGVFAVADPNVSGDMNTYTLMGQMISGTATTIGLGVAILGNARESGQVGNARGRLALFGPSYGAAQIVYDGDTNSSVLIPDVSATDAQYLAAGTTDGVGNEYSPVYMNNKGVLTECTSYRIDVPNRTTVTQTLPTGTYLMTLNRTGSTITTRDGVWLVTAGSNGHMLEIAKGSTNGVAEPTISGKTVTVTGNTTQLQMILRRIG